MRKALAPSTSTTNKVLTKKKKPADIEKIIGNTVTHHSCAAVSPNGEEVAYCAGCTVVIYSPKKNKQLRFLQNPSENKPLTSVCFSSDGKRVAAGESGYQPSVLVWDACTGRLICDLKEDRHKFGVRFVLFSPDNKYLVSVGNEHDGTIKIWANKAKSFELVCSKTNPRKTNAIAFAADGSYFVTAGAKHVIYWTFRSTTFGSKTEVMATKANLNTFSESTIVAVACAKQTKDGLYCLTTEGILCLIDSKKAVDKWVELKVLSGFSISVVENYVCCGCATGFIRLFETKTLKHKGTLPKPPPVGTHITSSNWVGNKPVGQLPIPGTISVDLRANHLTAFYEDRTMIVWDISNLQHFTKYRSMISHSDSVMDVDYLPECNTSLPKGTFVTCSTDNTIRFWNIDGEEQSSLNIRGSIAQQNLFFRDLLHIINIPYARNSESETGIKCVRFSPDGDIIASGDFQGNVRVYDVHSFKALSDTSAHDTVVTTMDFTQVGDKLFFATGSRDRHVHLFHLNEKICQCVATFNEHSGAITCVKFAQNDGVRLLSCGTDKSIKFRFVSADNIGDVELYDNKAVPYGTVFDMDIDTTQKYAVTTGQDKRLNIWDLKKKSSVRSYKTEVEADVIKVKIDPSGVFAAGSFTDKTIRLYDFFNGSFVKKFKGHSEVVTGITFSHDGRRLITVSGDGCIFVWRLPTAIVSSIQERLAELHHQRLSPPVTSPKKVENVTQVFEQSPAPSLNRPGIPNDQIDSLRSMALRNSQDQEPNETLENPIEINLVPSLPSWAKAVRENTEEDGSITERKKKNAWMERQVAQFQLPQHNTTIVDQTNLAEPKLDERVETCQDNSPSERQQYSNQFNSQYEDEDDVVYTSDSEMEDNGAEEEADKNVLVYETSNNDEEDFLIKSLETPPPQTDGSDEEKVVESEPEETRVSNNVEETESKQSEFVSKHYSNLDKPVAISDMRRSVTYQFILKKSQNEDTVPEEQDLRDVINALPPSRFTDLTSNSQPMPPPEPNNRSSIFDNLNLIRQHANKKKHNTPNFKKDIDQYLNYHKEALTKYDEEKKLKEDSPDEKQPEESQSEELSAEDTVDEQEENQNTVDNDAVVEEKVDISDNGHIPQILVTDIIATTVKDLMMDTKLPTPESSESVIISTPIQVSQSINLCKNKIETLSRVFSETMQSIDDIAKSIGETEVTEEEEVEQVTGLINEVQHMLDSMKENLSNKIQSTNISTALSGRLSLSQTSSTRNVAASQSLNLSSLDAPEVADVLEKYSSMMVELFMKKLSDKTKE